ncbi:MAG: DUF2236 domain-containing protein [Actinomycetota bacterium]|nr:DUF2236 domain-containing protein [Actinomycetota bacterium]
MTWRIHQESVVVLLGWPRAILLQLAHPLVAAGVAQHSTFRGQALQRLRHTLDASADIVFGTTDQALAAIAQINAIHRRVKGALAEPVGRFPAGAGYRAQDPELLLWVFATTALSELLVYSRYVAPLSPAEQERYHDEGKQVAQLLGIPDRLVPERLSDLCDYVDATLASDNIAIGPSQRELARAVLYPCLPVVPGRLLEPLAAITVGLLPDKVLDGYQLRLTSAGRHLHERSPALVRRLLPLLPEAVRHLPRCRAQARLQAA